MMISKSKAILIRIESLKEERKKGKKFVCSLCFHEF